MIQVKEKRVQFYVSLAGFKSSRHKGQAVLLALRWDLSEPSSRLGSHLPPSHPAKHDPWNKCPHLVRTIILSSPSFVSIDTDDIPLSKSSTCCTLNSVMHIQHSRAMTPSRAAATVSSSAETAKGKKKMLPCQKT